MREECRGNGQAVPTRHLDVVASDPTCSADEGLGCGLSQLSANLSVTKDAGSPAACPNLTPPASGSAVITRGVNPATNRFGSAGNLPVATDCIDAIRLEATSIPDEAQTDVLEWRFQIDVI